MSAIDPFRQLVKEWDTNEATIASQIETIAALQRENEALLEQLADETPEPTEYLFYDDFTGDPQQAPGEYIIDAPELVIFSTGTRLIAEITSHQPVDENKRRRSELRLWDPERPDAQVFLRDPFFEVRWYAVTVEIPLEWKKDPDKALFLQWHGSEDEGEKGIGRNPCLCFQVWNDKIQLIHLWSATKIQTGNENRRTLAEWPLVVWLGNPRRIIVKVTWTKGQTPTSVPALQIWLDGSEIVSDSGPQGYNDDLGPWFSFGLYCPSWAEKEHPPSGLSHDVSFSRLRIGGPGNVLEDFV